MKHRKQHEGKVVLACKVTAGGPANLLFLALTLLAFGGLIGFALTHLVLFREVFSGRNVYARAVSFSYLPLILSLLSIMGLFKLNFTAVRRHMREQEADHQQHLKDIEHGYEAVMIALVAALESRDYLAQGHSLRVVAFAQAIADRLGLTSEQRRDLSLGGHLHDVGKIGINDALLHKTAGLTEEEWQEMRRHPVLGLEILEGIDFLGGALDVILYHHERYDGRGYPHGLAGEKIPLLARVFAVADAFDAMTADRPYRQALSIEDARRIIKDEAGRQFCPSCVRIFLSLTHEELDTIRARAEDCRPAFPAAKPLDLRPAFPAAKPLDLPQSPG